jgi:hypothetical protein
MRSQLLITSSHHYLTILLDEELFLAPVKEENMQVGIRSQR